MEAETRGSDDQQRGALDKGITKIGVIEEVSETHLLIRLDPFEKVEPVKVEVKKIVELNHHQIFRYDNSNRLLLEDGLKCDYSNRTIKAKIMEICFKLTALVEKMDFDDPGIEDLQKESISIVRDCLDIITFQSGLDRSRTSRTDCIGRLAVHGQGHCHGVSSTFTGFFLPLAPLLGFDLKYRGCFTFDNGVKTANNSVERHQCVEVTARPSCTSYVVDLWKAEEFKNKNWLNMDINIAYNRFMYPNGALLLNTRPQELTSTDLLIYKQEEEDKEATLSIASSST